VHEACAKCFAVHLSKFFENFIPHETQNKTNQNANSIGEKLKTKGLFFFIFLCVICKLSNSNM
jgi:hypothetical protein